jgi:hypothetical protein
MRDFIRTVGSQLDFFIIAPRHHWNGASLLPIRFTDLKLNLLHSHRSRQGFLCSTYFG